MGKTILLSSHILPELGELCTKVAIIERGKLVAFGSVPELVERARVGRALRIGVTDPQAALALLGQHSAVKKVELVAETAGAKAGSEQLHVDLAEGADPAELSQLLVGHGLRLTHLAELDPSLEEIFLSFTQGQTA